MPATRLKIFISSVQKEFEQERHDLKAFLLGDAFLHRFIENVFLFEELPAKDRRADEVYLQEVERCDIYLAILGYEYGYEDDDGISPTEHEYDRATQIGKPRFIYVWGKEEDKRHSKMKNLVRKASNDLIRRRVLDFSALTSEVYSSLVEYLDDIDALHIPPFDTAACDSATMTDLDDERINWFLETARRERALPLKTNTTPESLLAHLNLLEDGNPTNAAVLLFGRNPQKYHRPAETKCVHCHGTEYRRPFPSLQTYGGDVFQQADQAVDFVLSKISRAVGTRSETNIAPATYELPPEAVGEAIINAIAHRDYNSNGSVEVRVFADRLEVWNPGSLPGNLTLESLRTDHASVPNNPLLAEPLYLARYIERVGSGTQTMIDLCTKSGLPEPTFEQRAGFFVTTLWRNWLADRVLEMMDLSEQEYRTMVLLRTHGRITNEGYQEELGVSKATATRHLNNMVKKGLIKKVGSTGKGTHYVLSHKGLTKGSSEG